MFKLNSPTRSSFKLLFKRNYASYGVVEIGPLSMYQRKLESGLIEPNEEQAITIVKLQKLCEVLIDYQPPLHPPTQFKFNHPIKSILIQAHIIPDNDSTSLISLSPTHRINPGPKGLWIHGQVGTGKTMMMDMFFDTIPIQRKKRIHFHQFSVAVYSRIHQWHKSNTIDKDGIHVTTIVAKDLMNEAWLLCFDEFQVSDVATASVLNGVLSEMFRMGAVMVTTSNRIPSDLVKGQYQKEFFTAYAHMIDHNVTVHEIRNTEDYRTLIHMESPVELNEKVYYRKDKPEEDIAFQKRVLKIFYGKQDGPKLLNLYGRGIHIKRSTKDTALFTFEELCGSTSNQVLGAPDYLRVCQEFPTIILQNIPLMDFSQKNEARRFITFIDAAYENKVHLILSASADPANLFLAVDTVDDSDSVMHKEMMGELLSEVQNRSKPTSLKLALFTGEEESFAFFRAVSRLNEMTSHQWLQDKHTAKSVDGQMRNEVYTGNQVPDIMMQESKGDNDTLGSLDFADEASYSGYVEMYDRYAMQDVKEKPIERKSENMFNRVESMLKVKEVRQPRFQDAHFWGFKKWGSNAGNWGQGLGKFFNSNDKK